ARAIKWAKRHSGKVNGVMRFGNLSVRQRSDVEMRPMTMEQALAQIGELRGTYFPRQRKSGEFVLVAKKEGANSVRMNFDIPALDEEGSGMKMRLGKATNQIMAQLGRIPFSGGTMASEARRLKNEGYAVEVSRDESISDDMYSSAGLVTALDAALQSSMAGVDMNSPESVKAGQLINKLLTMQAADIIKTRGFLSSRLKRVPEIWEGYETDMGKAYTGYAKGVAAGVAKRETAKKMILAFSGRDYSWQQYKEEVQDGTWEEWQDIVEQRRIDPGKQKNLFGDVRTFMVDVLRNDEQIDRIIGTMKGLAVLKFLSFRISSAAVNATNMVTGVVATLSGHLGISISKALVLVGQAGAAYGQYRRGKGAQADRAIFQEITNRGWDNPLFNQEAMRETSSQMGEAWDKVMTWGMYLFGAVEKFNRATTIFAAYKHLLTTNPEMSDSVRWEQAKLMLMNLSPTFINFLPACLPGSPPFAPGPSASMS
ncbi:MAG: hypothetical protein RI601_12665, partial [Desulfurivibrionaceae bacterium]|nr:hypothetical protein [Desulfurivibrionaceae bacterium]